MNQIAKIEPQNSVALTVSDVLTNAKLVEDVLQNVMKADTHYGVIPGTKKNTLYKAGSEKLLSTFRICVEPEIEDISTEDEIRYRIKAKGIHQTSGIVVGFGVGECSSNEEKYKWRRAVCDQEYNATPENKRRIKYVKARTGQIYENQQIRTEPADQANTVLKMAKKRAQIDLTLTATAASDIFDQDLEDNVQAAPQQNTVQQPQRTQPAKEGHGHIGVLRSKLDASGIPEKDLLVQFNKSKIEEITVEEMNVVLTWIADNGA